MKPKMPDDETLRRYLLGQLPEPERDALEERLIVDGEWRAEVDAAERDLIDDYVRGGLERNDIGSFERLFFASERRRQKVTFARALAGRASSAALRTAESQTESRSWLSLIFPGSRPVIGLALAAVILLMVAGAVWVVVYRQSLPAERAGNESNPERAEQPAVPGRPKAQETPEQNNSNRSPVTAENIVTPGQTPSRREQTPSVASFLILPGSLRGSNDDQLITIPTGAKSVRLRLSLEGQPATGDVRAELRRVSADGELVSRTRIMRARSSSLGPVVSLDVPADKLKPGKYTALIKSAGGEGRVEAIYVFNVRRK